MARYYFVENFCKFSVIKYMCIVFEVAHFTLVTVHSPVFFRLLFEGFHLTPRPRDCLPPGFPPNTEGTCHFLDKYVFPYAEQPSDRLSSAEHIDLAVKYYRINEN